MTVIIQSKTRYIGTVTPADLNVETVIVDISDQPDDYLIEGYIDLSNMQSGDTVVVKEYIAVEGDNYKLFTQVTYSGIQQEPIIRFHTKTLLHDMKYKVTVTQTAGTLKSFPYRFILEIMGAT